jgi:hypothetical protein
MKILLQPSSGRKAMEHFEDTVEGGVPLSSLKNRLSREDYSVLAHLKKKNIKTWGFVPAKDGSRKEWEEMEKGDWSLFYANRKFFYFSKVYLKIRDRELAEYLWGLDDNGNTWEFIYFIEEGKQIEIPYKPEIINKIDGNPYSPDHILQGALLLDGPNAVRMKEYVESFGGGVVEEDINPSEEETAEAEKISRTINTPEEAKKMMEELTLQIEKEPTKKVIKTVKSWVRNSKLSRLIKEKTRYKCEICGEEPFYQKNGTPYAETHHILELAKSGLDLPKNMICVCPTCHRILHYGTKEALDKRKMLRKSL